MNSNTLPIHERFLTFQGEGAHAGKRAFFIRTMGCPVQCPWCDSAGTWHPEWMPKGNNRVSLADLLEEVIDSQSEIVVITGGEPLIHPQVQTFASMLKAKGIRVHVETCGAFYQDPTAFDWITVSPKKAQLPLASMVHASHELKLIVEDDRSVDYWLTTLSDILNEPTISTYHGHIWLHPEWSQRKNPSVLNCITNTVTELGRSFRAGYQLHKIYNSDALDNRARPVVPLGGNINLGTSI